MTSPALQLSEVRKSFGRTSIINGVNLAIATGERHAIIGPNGAGKSTLFNLISGRFPVSAGRIELNGEDITGLEPHLINRKGLARSFQITNIFPRLSVYENLRCAVLWSLGYKYSFWHRIGALKEVRVRADEIVAGCQFSGAPRNPLQRHTGGGRRPHLAGSIVNNLVFFAQRDRFGTHRAIFLANDARNVHRPGQTPAAIHKSRAHANRAG